MSKDELIKYKENLKKDTLNKITEDFDEGELSNKQIIQKYGLTILPSELKSILPLKETKTMCPYCGEHMYHERLRKKEKDFDLVCLLCNHKIYSTNKSYLKCTCENCISENEKRKEEIKELIEKIYSKNEIIKWEDIQFENMVTLFMILCINPNSDTKTINKGGRFIDQTYYQLIDDLYKKNIISVSSKSDPEAFYVENGKISFNEEKVIWNVNISFDDNVMKFFKNKKFPINKYKIEEKEKYLKKVLMGQLIYDVKIKMNERGRLFNPTIESVIRYTKVLKKLSYTQIEYLNFKTVVWACDFYKVKGYSYTILEKTILNFICDNAEKYKKNNWEVYKSNPNYITDKLRFIIERVFCETVEILNVPIKDIFN